MAEQTSTNSRGLGIATSLTLLIGAATLITGGIGIFKHNEPLDFWSRAESLYETVALLVLNNVDLGDSPKTIVKNLVATARILAVIFASLALSTILAVIYKTFSPWFRSNYIAISSSIRKNNSHSVIFGLSDISLNIIRNIRNSKNKRDVIVLEANPDNPNIVKAQQLGALVLIRDVQSSVFWEQAKLSHAKEIFISTGHDALNLDIAGDLEKLAKNRDETNCFIHLQTSEFLDIFNNHNLFNQGKLEFHTFNKFENAARELMLNKKNGLAMRYAPKQNEVQHYILAGFGTMGQITALNMARLSHFSNHKRLRLSIVDSFDNVVSTDQTIKTFQNRYPGFGPEAGFDLAKHIQNPDTKKDDWGYKAGRPKHKDWCFDDPNVVEYAVNCEFLSTDSFLSSPETLNTLITRLKLNAEQNPPIKAGFVICFDDENQNFREALDLQEALSLLKENTIDEHTPIFAYVPTEEGLHEVLANQKNSLREGHFPIIPFGQLNSCSTHSKITQLELRTLAKQFHEKYAIESKQPVEPYESLTQDMKISNEQAATHKIIKKRNLEDLQKSGLNEADATKLIATTEHHRWMAERMLAGWRYDSERDNSRKRRDQFVPTEQLSREEQNKDVIQVSNALDSHSES